MEQGMLYHFFAYAGSVALILGFLPQAVETMRTRNTDGISMPAFLLMSVGAFCFMMQGFLHKPDVIWSVAITNLITCVCSCVVFGIKLRNDFFSKR